MEDLDPAEEWQRLSDVYRGMNDDELLNLAKQYSELTEVAQQVLKTEISERRLEMPKPELQEPEPWAEEVLDPEQLGSPYDEDRELVDVAIVWSRRDAHQLKAILGAAEIPVAFGKEKATDVERVTSDLSKGVTVQTMKIAVPMATEAIKSYSPADEPQSEEPADSDVVTLCPKCHSKEVYFGDLSADPESQSDSMEELQWTCDSCGQHWKDDVATTA
jgi:DNA-directed RNA polymerase subunit M/transcription elongation factor TFIIS